METDEAEQTRVAPGKRSLASRYPALAERLDDRRGGEPTIHDAATAAVEHKGAGAAVDPAVAARVGAHLGADLSSVKVHSDPLAQQATAAMGARAFAYGGDVFLGPGESGGDLGLMAHELTHVVQQGAAGQRAPQRAVQVGEADSPAEREADQVAADVTSGRGRPATLLVDAGPVGPGQMLKSQFFEQLRAQVTAAADAELGPIYSAIGCPYIEQYFGRYAGQPAASAEALLRRYAPAARNAATAADLIPAVVTRVREGVRAWRDTGAPPPELAAAAPEASTTGGAQAQAQALRAPDGSETLASLGAELGPGQPLDGATANRMSDALGIDVSAARIHTGPVAARKAAEVGALAFAVGPHVVMAAGAPAAGTLEGDALLAHELVHTAQQADAASDPAAQRKPIGAESSTAEDHADAAAAGAIEHLHGDKRGGLGQRLAAAARTGVQLQRCNGNKPDKEPKKGDKETKETKKTDEGKITHEGNVGEGKVTARENDLDPSDKTVTNYSLEYAGKDADKAHWLQFVNFTMYADEPGKGKVYYTGSVATSSGHKPFSTDKVTNWSVDSGSGSDPYYESTGSNVRDPKKSTKIFDMPGGASIEPFAAQLVATKAPKATKVTFIAGFATYLVLDDKAVYQVAWTATTEYDPAKKASAPIVYGTGGARAVTGLPKNFKTVLDGQYAGNKIQ